ncbi:peptidoglycan editing factor PgeF [Paenibacillus flagellatus]|uniref:Purine nucleoside phosphorylase n=1 Tax=Paenibacillus flagellatus TaxID=2211139 RepID=A0A2V5K5B2_9BACL|nr:peptidoglycan editing factor PgeF [Paenibacillus flagellatus]PYI54565.1 peptidoglycan editing factor PgeF [Paenibacillus flagellatus]
MASFRLTERPGEPAFFTIDRWEREYPFVTAGFTTRKGGVSGGSLASLNCALHVQDDPAHVVENRKRLASALHVPFEAWTCGEQVHGDVVTVVTKDERGRGRAEREDALPGTDALITDRPGVWLTSFYADCVPLYLFDPVRRAVGLAHAGWKGTVLEIAARTVEAMTKTFGSSPADVRAAIGPSIGDCCYEVDGHVIGRIDECLDRLGADESVRRTVYRPAEEPGKSMLNLQEMNRQIMIKAGILPTHIEICGMCTGCRTDLFFSHRKEKGSTGRMASWIGLDMRSSAPGS